MKRFFRHTLKREVFLLSLAYSLLFSLVFILIISNVLYDSRLSQMKEKLHGSNAQIITYMNALFDHSKQLLAYFEDTLDLTSKDPQVQEESLAAFHNAQAGTPNIQYIFVGYGDGSLLISGYDTPEEFRSNLRPWYQKAAEKYPAYVIAYPYQEYISKEWRFCSAKALANANGEIVAVVAVEYSVESLYKNALMQCDYDTQVNFLIDENGVCVYHPLKTVIGSRIVDNLQGDPRMFSGEEGYIEYTLGGESLFGYFHHITGSDSILVSSVDRSDVFVPALSGVIDIVLGLLLLSVLTSVAFMTLFDRRYVRPVKALKARVAALLEGKSIADDPGTYPNREFLEIAGSMEGLTQRILSQKTEELNAILESSSDGILVLDHNDRVLHYNTRFLILWGLAKNAAYQTFGDLELHKRLLEESTCPHPSKQTQGTEIFYLKSGVILERHTKVLTGQGHIDGILCVFGDVTQKMKKEELLKEIANTDFLTGLNNRRYFTFLAAREFRRAAESREPLALLMIDIDNFKLINDTYGHDIGDRALKTSSMHLRHCSRQSDILGRYGGEEFTVLLPQTDADTAVRIAERVRGHFENAAIEHKGSRISWTISIGVANLDGRVSSVKTLIKHADVACYMAKQNGRNCVKSYTGAQKKFRPEKE